MKLSDIKKLKPVPRRVTHISWDEYMSSLNGLKGLVEFSKQRGMQNFYVEEVLDEYHTACCPYGEP